MCAQRLPWADAAAKAKPPLKSSGPNFAQKKSVRKKRAPASLPTVSEINSKQREGTFVKEDDPEAMSFVVPPRINSADKRTSRDVLRADAKGQPREANIAISSETQSRPASSQSHKLENPATGNRPSGAITLDTPPESSEDTPTMEYDARDLIKQAASDSQVQELKSSIGDLTDRLVLLEQENASLKDENEVFEQAVQDYKSKHDKTSEEIRLLKDEWRGLSSDLEATKQENTLLHQKLSVYDNALQEIEDMTKEREALEAKLAEREKSTGDVEKAKDIEVQALQDRIVQLEKDLVAKDRSSVDVKGVMSAEMEALRKELADVKQENASLKEKVKKLEEKVALSEQSIETVHAENRDLQEKQDTLEKTLASAQATASTIQKEKNALRDDITKLKETNEQQSRHVEELQKDTAKLQVEKIDLKNDMQVLTDKNSKLTVDNVGLQEKIAKLLEANKDISGLSLERDELKETLAKCTEQRDLAKKEAAEWERKYYELERDGVSLRDTYGTLQKEKVDLFDENSKLSLKIKQMEESAKLTKESATSMSQMVKEKQSHVDDLRREIENLRETNSKYLQKIEALETSKGRDDDVVRSKLDDIQLVHKNALDENKKLRTALAHKNMHQTESDTEITVLRTKLDLKDEELAEAAARNEALERLITQLKADVDTVDVNSSSDSYLVAFERRKMMDKIHSRISNSSLWRENETASTRSLPHSLASIETSARVSVVHDPDSNPKLIRKSLPAMRRREVDHDTAPTPRTSHDAATVMRDFRYSDGYMKRFKNRPSNVKKIGILTKVD